MKKIVRSITNKALLFSMLISSNTLMSRETIFDKSMYTINPKVKLDGPLLQENGRVEYNSELFKIILNEANQYAGKYLTKGDTKAYWSFLVLALTVPLHESSLTHIREVQNEAGLCSVSANSGERVEKRAGTRALKIFQKYFKEPTEPFLANCNDLTRDEMLTQLIHGPDGADLGIMQVSFVWHESIYLVQKCYKSVQKSLHYGIGILNSGFENVYRNASKYSCLYEKNALSYNNLMRGIWGGKYNSGNYQATCRFVNAKSPYVQNDKAFKRTLDKILDYEKSKVYQMRSEEQAAFKQILDNYKNGDNKTDKLLKYINFANTLKN